jgi:hypothetical protein
MLPKDPETKVSFPFLRAQVSRHLQRPSIASAYTYEVIEGCPLQADLVLVSSDGHRFGAHTKNLGEFTGSFPLHLPPANGEEVQMPDVDFKALPLFLRYVHHHRQPDLSNVPFTTLRQLAEAVEKYDVYSATEICKVQML